MIICPTCSKSIKVISMTEGFIGDAYKCSSHLFIVFNNKGVGYYEFLLENGIYLVGRKYANSTGLFYLKNSTGIIEINFKPIKINNLQADIDKLSNRLLGINKFYEN